MKRNAKRRAQLTLCALRCHRPAALAPDKPSRGTRSPRAVTHFFHSLMRAAGPGWGYVRLRLLLGHPGKEGDAAPRTPSGCSPWKPSAQGERLRNGSSHSQNQPKAHGAGAPRGGPGASPAARTAKAPRAAAADAPPAAAPQLRPPRGTARTPGRRLPRSPRSPRRVAQPARPLAAHLARGSLPPSGRCHRGGGQAWPHRAGVRPVRSPRDEVSLRAAEREEG